MQLVEAVRNVQPRPNDRLPEILTTRPERACRPEAELRDSSFAWPAAASWAIGLLVGINMIFFGVSLAMISLAARDFKKA